MSDYDYEDEQEYNENEYARYGYDGEYQDELSHDEEEEDEEYEQNSDEQEDFLDEEELRQHQQEEEEFSEGEDDYDDILIEEMVDYHQDYDEYTHLHTLEDYAKNVAHLALVPMHPESKWLGWWDSNPTQFLNHCLSLAVWCSLETPCFNQALTTPTQSLKIYQKVRQRFKCPDTLAHAFQKSQGIGFVDAKGMWVSGHSTCEINYEIKRSPEDKSKFIVRYQVRLYSEQCPKCLGSYLPGELQKKVMVGIVNRFVERIAKATKLEPVKNPGVVLVDFRKVSERIGNNPIVEPATSKVWKVEDIPKHDLFVRESQNPLLPISFVSQYPEEQHSTGLRINWWDVSFFEQMFKDNKNYQAVLRKAPGFVQKEDQPHDERRCQACSQKRCQFSNGIKSDEVQHYIIDADEEMRKVPSATQKSLEEIRLKRQMHEREAEKLRAEELELLKRENLEVAKPRPPFEEILLKKNADNIAEPILQSNRDVAIEPNPENNDCKQQQSSHNTSVLSAFQVPHQDVSKISLPDEIFGADNSHLHPQQPSDSGELLDDPCSCCEVKSQVSIDLVEMLEKMVTLDTSFHHLDNPN